jgi:hypothetical protein
MKETWISAAKIKKMFNLEQEDLNQLEREGKVQTMLAVGNRKLYLAASLEGYEKKTKTVSEPSKHDSSKTKPSFLKRLLSKFF